ncbi:hypothetical protein [Acaryochloris sp. 'Moss Beach']|uniref:hypothetical protein n=1 Tax=Acaryochloris sp. 'Moss Beach' TaxID=2740837 RepID=UPI001F48CBD7|nr:hypothetical protein [Acaryochloris sp. 'Moss Beach']
MDFGSLRQQLVLGQLRCLQGRDWVEADSKDWRRGAVERVRVGSGSLLEAVVPVVGYRQAAPHLVLEFREVRGVELFWLTDSLGVSGGRSGSSVS